MSESFFREVEPRPYDEDDHLPPFDLPAWTGPPWHRAPGTVLLDHELGRSDTTVVALDVARCYEEGLLLRLTVRVSDTGRRARQRVFEYLERAHGRGQLDERFAPDGLRWGVAFADGRTVTTQDESPWAGTEDVLDAEIAGPVLEGGGRPSVFMDSWSRDVWLWPLPPLPALRVAVEWSSRGIAETVTSLDVGPLLEASARSHPLWPTTPS
ncbi:MULTISPECIES: hypothetical protein [unclassified Rathayibacter]|uniref:hypothetical protein n=1 Tax=unclassified Rathayibacter TaxID=2609250 RepID=UPI00188B7FB9|nr:MULTISPECIES: hypothetical protein [unclassified Rathayibacter]MBF4462801.1 hypothetical protein [Rathayibacter sp. VKM Ac-2879]MBF4504215.1 hypothetical protein [Rathayibacter sp. VKM Ac-2878]